MKKVALVGTTSSNAYAPIDDLSWEIWGVGFRNDNITRANRWFELHKMEVEGRDFAAEWREHMRTWKDCQVWMFFPKYDLGIDVVAFDHVPLAEAYGTFFMTSSMAWMMAQAIEEKYDEIGLWGIDLEAEIEYRQQRAGVRHFMEVAKLKGIHVTTIPSSGIAYQPQPYPFWQNDPIVAKTKLQHRLFVERHKIATDKEDALVVKMHKLDGARQELANILRAKPKDVFEQIAKRHQALTEEVVGVQQAALQERDAKRRIEGAMTQLEWLESYLLQ